MRVLKIQEVLLLSKDNNYLAFPNRSIKNYYLDLSIVFRIVQKSTLLCVYDAQSVGYKLICVSISVHLCCGIMSVKLAYTCVIVVLFSKFM